MLRLVATEAKKNTTKTDDKKLFTRERLSKTTPRCGTEIFTLVKEKPAYRRCLTNRTVS